MLAAQKVVDTEQELLTRLVEARSETDRLFAVVRPDSLYERPIPERHRIVFYIGHLEAFDWNLLRGRLVDTPTFHPEFDKLFAFGIDPVGGGLPADQPQDWPSLSEIQSYNHQIREALDAKIADAARHGATSRGNDDASAEVLLNVAIEHRLMHAETLAYMLHQLPVERKIAPPHDSSVSSEAVVARMIHIPEGSATLGLSRRDTGVFGWDNEFEAHRAAVPAFAIDQYKITNGQFLKFIEAGGYETRSLWSEDAWAWKTQSNISHPVFWKKLNGQWYFVGMFEEIALPLDWPVYVSHAEASAYARWVGKALPSEAQWHRAACTSPDATERAYPWGNESPGAKHGNFDFQRWNPASVNAFPGGRSAWGVDELVGNGWEWTSTVFEPFAGFRAFPFYAGYSANFFDGKHYVMKGGSTRTAACMLRKSFRNWFQSNYQYVYAGFRCVAN
jgi:ergothioneine biosynthesis protein EgtB